ncbi:MAG: hypothetical protein KBS41_03680 [Oscillospiraceae bacterium]|nr:hypothetical protein [Candidatus Equicaccousia limihippi]
MAQLRKDDRNLFQKIIDFFRNLFTASKGTEFEQEVESIYKRLNKMLGEDNKNLNTNNAGKTKVLLSKGESENHWLLTACQNKEETVESAAGEVRDSLGATAATPTLSRRNGVNSTVSTNIIPTTP